MTPDADSLNEFQATRVRVTCQYIANLLGEIENILRDSISKRTFPRHRGDISPAQRKTIEDYLARICAQLKRVLDGQGINLQAPTIPASRAIAVTLGSIDIAAEELRPQYMRGYGAVPETAATELNGIAGELQSLVARLERYLLDGVGQDLKTRLERLEDAGNDFQKLGRIEEVVANRGLVEYRPAILSILDRAETRTFEIAVFGRVSSGKSSLLNAILKSEVLPVGVTPVTAVPTRITHGERSCLQVFFAEAAAKTFEVGRLAEFATEQQNPRNSKRVTRIVVELPAQRLKQGVAFVDTPGLGSLATSGAAEALAYLPKCDLGVVLIDAGATLTADDLQTIQTLQEAAVPVSVLLSKADLLNQADQEKLLAYVKAHIASECNLDSPVHPVSVIPSHQEMLNRWFSDEIFPLYERSEELREASMRRKIGTLRESVISALRVRLRRKNPSSTVASNAIRRIEVRLRRATGLIQETQAACQREIESISNGQFELFELSARKVIESWMDKTGQSVTLEKAIGDALAEFVHRRIRKTQDFLNTLGYELRDELRRSAEELEIADAPGENEFQSLVHGAPLFDPGSISISFSRPKLGWIFGRQFIEKRLARQIRRQIEVSFEHALETHLRILTEWVRTVTGGIRGRFETYAECYRAQAERALGEFDLDETEMRAIEDDLRSLGKSHSEDIPDEAGVRPSER